MANALTTIEQRLTAPDVTNRLIVALGLTPDNEQAQQEAFRYASSVLAEIKRVDSDPKRSLSGCSPDSIVQAMVDAASYKLAIDGRQQAHLVKYGAVAQLQIGYRGYIAKISEHYKDADFTAEAVFNGDTVTMSDNGGFQSYTITKANAFAEGWDKLQGVIVRLSYSKGGDKFQKVTAVSKGDLVKIRAAAKQDFIWNQWPIEKAKAAAIKRACKIQFADVMGLQEIIRYDNEANFDLDNAAAPTRSTIIDNINQSVTGEQPTIEHEPAEQVYPLTAGGTTAQLNLADWVNAANTAIDGYTDDRQKAAFLKANKDAIEAVKLVDAESATEIEGRLA